MSGPVRAVLTMAVPPARAEEFELAWQQVASWAREQPGCLRQSLCAADGAFVITSDWSDEESFRRFERSPEQDELTAGLRRLRTSARMEVQRILHHH
ncbi:antibiotic biosynthesis monooxygenase [Nonomuraea turkmeniaca]|uniref:Antibiotic biosynthesis monooxygenase n=1 Tax=Nonomuraea turkmeniaca TaxID=103838 RepID=A0A5S4EUY3_9ACTN|nr:antibiotic biosynthesis monooxygenase family protein [Nonomuraea turkmeniaca]TMR06720.1 antibiotic biosynthesis monooxygenase [Nonomuraea turkmeniaca]